MGSPSHQIAVKVVGSNSAISPWHPPQPNRVPILTRDVARSPSTMNRTHGRQRYRRGRQYVSSERGGKRQGARSSVRALGGSTPRCMPDYGYGVREILFLIKLKRENKLQVGRDDADAGKNDPPSRWRRAAFLASRLRDGNRGFQNLGVSGEEGAIRKELETQHWLELIDGYLPHPRMLLYGMLNAGRKHRYGSNR